MGFTGLKLILSFAQRRTVLVREMLRYINDTNKPNEYPWAITGQEDTFSNFSISIPHDAFSFKSSYFLILTNTPPPTHKL